MAREVCFFDKFSYCKNGDSCRRLHLKEVCLVRGCDYRKCEKRHPNPCKTFMLKGFCRFGTSCKYSHRLSKEAEEQNEKIESLEEVTKKLTKQIADQNEEIKTLKRDLLDTKSRELKNLQHQIDSLVKSNDEKEKAIRTVEEELLMEVEENDDEGTEQIHVGVEEAVGHEEICEAEIIKKDTIEYAQKCLPHLEKFHLELKKLKNNNPDLTKILVTKCKEYCERLKRIEVNVELCEEVIGKVDDLKEYLTVVQRKPERERELRVITDCKKYLTGYLRYPKRPHQIPMNTCCTSCYQKS